MPSQAVLLNFARFLSNDRPSDMFERIEGEQENWDFEDMVTVEVVDISFLRRRVREMRLISEDGGEAVPTSIAK